MNNLNSSLCNKKRTSNLSLSSNKRKKETQHIKDKSNSLDSKSEKSSNNNLSTHCGDKAQDTDSEDSEDDAYGMSLLECLLDPKKIVEKYHPTKNESLSRGDIIEYWHPHFVFGNSRSLGFGKGTILQVYPKKIPFATKQL